MHASEFEEGFYAIYYEGVAGQGVLLACMSKGRVVGADMGGGVLEGEYRIEAGSILAKCAFRFSAGQRLITGQKLLDDLEQKRDLVLPLVMLRGQKVRSDIGFGPLTARGKLVAPPIESLGEGGATPESSPVRRAS